uniref:Uncharacterized protein n=1 Tax=Arundo donax TaxID=35708 RepID=A0A0A9BM82_ARUDO
MCDIFWERSIGMHVLLEFVDTRAWCLPDRPSIWVCSCLYLDVLRSSL